MDRPGPIRLALFLTLGIVCLCFGAVLVRLASAPALAVASYRMLWATLLLTPALSGREFRQIPAKSWVQLMISGVALAFHFALWIGSLSYTSVASSVLLTDTSPFFLGLASHWILKRPCSRSFWTGLLVSFAGCGLIVYGDWSRSQNSLKGNLMALSAALGFSVYLLAGARLRQKLSLVTYVWPVYAVAAVALFFTGFLTSTPFTGYPRASYVFMFLLGLFPQSVGHTTYNWSLRWLSPAVVAVIGLAEPVGSSILAWALLHESLGPEKILGGAVVLFGIYVATRSEPSPK